jgi:hypothetical protein
MSKMSQSLPLNPKQWLFGLGIGLGLLLVIISLIGPLLSWPLVDESTYVLQARQMAEGMLPYRDFYDFVTPGSQFIGSLFIRLNGFSLLGLRMLIIVGWLVEILLIYTMGKNHLSKVGLGILLAFLWLSDSQYLIFQHHFWSGLMALSSVFMGWCYLQTLYNGKPQRHFISLCGILCAATFWATQSLGLILTAALMLYSLLHCFLHEREEKGVGYRHVSKVAVLARWFKDWGVYGALPWLAFHALCIATLSALGIWADFVRDTFQWLAGGHYYKTTLLGYYSTFAQDFKKTIQPFLDGVKFPTLLLFIFRFPIAFNLFFMGLLPIIGILGMGYALPHKFQARLLQREDDELLLLWLCATGMILSTMTYSTAMHILSNGSIAFLLGAIVISRFLARRPKTVRVMRPIANAFFITLLLGVVTSSLTMLLLDPWITPTKAMPDPLHYADPSTSSHQLVTLLSLLRQAEDQHQSVFIFSQSPNLYLVGHYKNPTRFVLVIPKYTSDSQIAEIMRDLERSKPLYIVDDLIIHLMHNDPRFAQYSPAELNIPELQAFLAAHYTLQGNLGRYGVFRRNNNYLN